MQSFLAVIQHFNISDALDILIVTFLLYRVILLIRGTRAVQLLKGIVMILLMTGVASYLNLRALSWILDKVLTIGLFAIPVVFQPELRRALEQIGRGGFFSSTLVMHKTGINEEEVRRMIGEIVKASGVLSKNKMGALMVLERDTGLGDFEETGTPIGAVVSSELLINTFIPNTPLHDGAVIIRDLRITAASCYLPLSDSPLIGKDLGTRHRAAIGISEHSDALSVVVSEETGHISLAVNGKLTRYLDEHTLKEMMLTLLMPQKVQGFTFFGRKAGGS